MTATKNVFPSDKFMRKHFGSNWPLVGRIDTGFFYSSRHGSLREYIQYVTITGPKNLTTAEDRSFRSVREIVVFKNYQLHDTQDVSHFRKVLAERIALETLQPDFERDLYDELSAYVIDIQPFTKDWWEWFAEDGNLGVRFKPHAKAGCNEPCLELDEILEDHKSQSYPA